MDWETRITGDDADLRMLAQAFTGRGVTIVERGSEFFLGGTEFASLTHAGTVRDRAREILASVSGASKLRLGSSKPIEVDHVVHLDGGRRHLTNFPEPAVLTLRALPVTLAVTRADGTVERHLPANPVVEDLLKAMQSDAVKKVLRLWNAPQLLWTDLYRIFEVIQDGGGPIKANKREVERFTRTANSVDAAGDLARHGKEDTQPPPKPMTLQEGRAFIERLISDWLGSK